MSNARRKSDGTAVQLTLPLSSLPSQQYPAGSLRTKEAVKEALRNTLANCGLSREVVADELSRLTGEQVSVHTLNNWIAPEKKDRCMPLEYASAVSIITGDHGVVQAAVNPADLQVLGNEELAFYELGRMTAEDKARAKKKKELMCQIKELS